MVWRSALRALCERFASALRALCERFTTLINTRKKKIYSAHTHFVSHVTAKKNIIKGYVVEGSTF